MRRFEAMQVEEAIAYASDGGQSLHLHSIILDWDRAPLCFRRAIERGEQICHLFDQDELRLVATAKRLGVRIIKVERAGTPRQHLDLCGAPMKRALAMCEEVSDER